jgi:hypothetical protein
LKSREKKSQHRESVFEKLIPPVARTDDFACPSRTSEDASDGNLGETVCTSSYRNRLSGKRANAALLFILFHKRVCGPLANARFQHRPNEALKPPASRVETAYHKADHAIQHVLDLLAA